MEPLDWDEDGIRENGCPVNQAICRPVYRSLTILAVKAPKIMTGATFPWFALNRQLRSCERSVALVMHCCCLHSVSSLSFAVFLLVSFAHQQKVGRAFHGHMPRSVVQLLPWLIPSTSHTLRQCCSNVHWNLTTILCRQNFLSWSYKWLFHHFQ